MLHICIYDISHLRVNVTRILIIATIKVGSVGPTQLHSSVCQYSRVSMFVIRWDSTFVIWCDRKHGQEYWKIFSKENGCFVRLQATLLHMTGENRKKKTEVSGYSIFAIERKQKIIDWKTCINLRTNTARLSLA